MVVIEEVDKQSVMFWGLRLDQGRRYSQTAEKSFHISMAALEPKRGSSDVVSVYIKHNGVEYLLCSLQQGGLLQQTLDLGFLAGETLTLFATGIGNVHLTGYLIHDEIDEDMMMGEGGEGDESDLSLGSSDEEEEDVGPPASKKSKQLMLPTSKGITKNTVPAPSDSEEDDEDGDEGSGEDDSSEDNEMDVPNGLLDFEAGESDDSDDEDFDEEEDEDVSEEDSEEEMSDSEIQAVAEEIRKKLMKQERSKGKTPDSKQKDQQSKTPQQPNEQKPKQSKTPQQQQQQQQGKNKTLQTKTPPQAKTPQQGKKESVKSPQQVNKDQSKTPQQVKKDQSKTPQQVKKGESKTPQQVKKEPVKTPQQPKDSSKTPQKRKLPSGITIEELKEGHGPEAKSSKMVHVYYTGKLASGKVFDSSTSGRPFKFRLGKNEVIKGWELGLQGMKVGGKRRLTIPPNLAYGNDRSSGLPPNSTLLFDVELKAIS